MIPPPANWSSTSWPPSPSSIAPTSVKRYARECVRKFVRAVGLTNHPAVTSQSAMPLDAAVWRLIRLTVLLFAGFLRWRPSGLILLDLSDSPSAAWDSRPHEVDRLGRMTYVEFSATRFIAVEFTGKVNSSQAFIP